MPNSAVNMQIRLETTLSNGETFVTDYTSGVDAAIREFHIEEGIKEKSCDEDIWKMFWEDSFFGTYYETLKSLKLTVRGKTIKQRGWDEN